MDRTCLNHPLSFLDLPTEIRLKVYRYLHVNSRTIGDSRHDPNLQAMRQYWDWDQFSMDWHGPRYRSSGSYWKRYDPAKKTSEWEKDPGSSTCSLSGQLLATCQKIYEESSYALYGENTFGLHIYVRDDKNNLEIESGFFEGQGLDELTSPWPTKTSLPRGNDLDPDHLWTKRFAYPFAVDKIQRLRIVIDLDYGREPIEPDHFNHLQLALGNACHRLSRVQLQYLNIDLRSRYPITRFCMLEPLMVLRKLRMVTFDHEPKNPTDDSRGKLQTPRRPRYGPKRPLANLPPRYMNHLKETLESATPVDDAFLEDYNY